MRSAAWFIVSELLLVLVIVLVFSNWHGTAGFSLGWPMTSSSLTINGEAHGARILLAFVSAILTIATFILGLVKLFQPRKAAVPPPPKSVPPATPAL
jgi:hypothetical protein